MIRGCRTLLALSVIALMACACSPRESVPESPPPAHQFVTTDLLEPDKLASLWLIKCFVDPEAQFIFLTNEVAVLPGIPVDMPQGDYRRYASMSCYESILQRHPVADPALARIARIIRELELNFWGDRRVAGAADLEQQIRQILQDHPNDPAACLPPVFELFDQLHRSLGSQP